MTDEEKKLIPTEVMDQAAGMAAQGQKPVYGGTFEQQLSDIYDKIQNREDFKYDVNADPLYQTYKNSYVKNARRSMQDTMGKAAGLTGGYGSTYSQGAGQQAYDQTMTGLNDKLPELYDMAFNMYQKEGDRLNQQFQLAGQMRDTEYSQWRDALGDYNYENETAYSRQQHAYSNLTNLIMKSGYQPSEQEMQAAGMSAGQAKALRQAWLTGDPNAAWMAGAISAEDYFKLTGQYPAGYQVPSAGGGEWYGGSGGKKKQKYLYASSPSALSPSTPGSNAGPSVAVTYTKQPTAIMRSAGLVPLKNPKEYDR